MPVRYDLSGATVTDVRRSVADQWMAQWPTRPDMTVQEAVPDVAGEPRGQWLFRGCEVRSPIPASPWGVIFVECRFRPFRRTWPIYGPVTLVRCDLDLREVDEGLSIAARDSRFTVPAPWRPTVENGSWLHRSEVTPDTGPFTRKGGYIRSDDHSLELFGDGLARWLDLPSDTPGWAASARFSLHFGTTAGGIANSALEELAAVRDAFRAQMAGSRRRPELYVWADRPHGGFACTFGDRLAVFDCRPDGGLEFWSGRIPASFATDAFGADVLLPNVPARLTRAP